MQYIGRILCSVEWLPLILNLISQTFISHRLSIWSQLLLVKLIGPNWEHSTFIEINLIFLAQALEYI